MRLQRNSFELKPLNSFSVFSSDLIVLYHRHPTVRLFADWCRDEANADIPAKKRLCARK